MNKSQVAITIKRILELSDEELTEISTMRNMDVKDLKSEIENLSDDETLYRYRTCALCGAESVTEEELEAIIINSNTIQEVFYRIGQPNCQHFLNMN